MKRIINFAVIMLASGSLMAMENAEFEAIAQKLADAQECFRGTARQSNRLRQSFPELNVNIGDRPYERDRCTSLWQEIANVNSTCQRNGKEAGRFDDPNTIKDGPCPMIMLFWQFHTELIEGSVLTGKKPLPRD